MPSFGEKLKLEREKRNITLEQISFSTKIGTRMLQALEEDRFSQLPGGIFNKGFVRAYAHVVGLDEDQAVADYLEASGEAPAVITDTVGHDQVHEGDAAIRIREREDHSGRLETRAEATSRQLPWGVFAAVLLIVALLLSLWTHRRREQEQSMRRLHEQTVAQPSPASPAEQNIAEPVNALTSSSSTMPPSRTSPKTGPRAASTPTVTPTQKPPLVARSPQSTPAPTPALSPTPAPASPPGPGEFTLVIQAHEESWLSITVDGKSIGSAVLAAGDARALHGRTKVIVKAGNVGGLSFLLNGKKLDVAGLSGQVKTLTIGPTGLLPEAPDQPAPQP